VVLSGNMDTDLQTMLGIDGDTDNPDFETLFGQNGEAPPSVAADTTKQGFAPVTAFEEPAKPFFNDKDYYRKVLASAGEAARRFHSLLTNFLNASDPQDRSMHRGRLMPAFWDLLSRVAPKAGPRMTAQQKMLLRFGVLSPTFLDPAQREMLAKVILENKSGEPVYYVDEWLAMVAAGTIKPSETDEIKRVKKDTNQRKVDLIEKRQGQYEAELSLLHQHLSNLDGLENNLSESVKVVLGHATRSEYNGTKDAYSAEQKKALSGLNDLIRRLSSADREVAQTYKRLGDLREEISELSEEVGGMDSLSVDSETIISEFNTIRQMFKMCVGRQGNHFPILMKNYLRANMADVATRENVLRELGTIEHLDPSVFHRSFKGQTNRIVPYIILVPCYGDSGICWEPFERRNKASSRGRVAVPMYPKKVSEAVITAVADLRWQVAKERAQHHWMEEGITGRYYQWFSDQKLRGDVKDAFVKDYILWITAESQGMQKLEREVRGIFWRMMPFPQELKDKLRYRGFVYDDLYKKDMNIARSDGY
jgi:hypothetical protein